ncbi:MAG: hydrogenase small subunit [Proteobacteria bacterium]|nr:hydrogenase small subunit [Pseudomonadota bacterium]
MNISRRKFFKYCIGSAASLGLAPALLPKLVKALENPGVVPNIIWIEGASCSGCSVSLANLIGDCSEYGPTDFPDLLFNYMNASFAKTFMTAAGDHAVESLRAAQQTDYILVVEGGVPTVFNGMTCTLFSENGVDVTMLDAVNELAAGAQAVVCVGTCSSYGGIPATGENLTGIKSVSECTGIPTINLPGCPAHPDWVAATIAKVLCGEEIVLDQTDNRPVDLYHRTVHYTCPRRPLYEKGHFATAIGQEGKCFYELGCRGPYTIADCSARGWNNGFNYCIQAGVPCVGCAEKAFPGDQLIKH